MRMVRRSRRTGCDRKSKWSSTPAATFGCASGISSARPPPSSRMFSRLTRLVIESSAYSPSAITPLNRLSPPLHAVGFSDLRVEGVDQRLVERLHLVDGLV